MRFSIVFALFLSTACASTAFARTLAEDPTTYNFHPLYGCFDSPPEGSGFVYEYPCDPRWPSIDLIDTCKYQVDSKREYRYHDPITVEACCYIKNLVKFGNFNDPPINFFDYVKAEKDPSCPRLDVSPCVRTNRTVSPKWNKSDALACCDGKKTHPADYKADFFCSDESYRKWWIGAP